MYPIEAKGDAKCLWYYMLSEEFLEQASSAGSRSVLPKINQKELSVLKVRIPSCTEEQREISRILDNIFEKERETKQSAEYVIEQIDLMKKSILSKAFRGELGTNNPKDERAEELLKRIIIGE
jgi:type I restriction enzyme S subunit